MATKKDIKLTYNIERLFEEFITSLGLSQAERDNLQELHNQLNVTIDNLSSATETFEKQKNNLYKSLRESFEKEFDKFKNTYDKVSKFLEYENKSNQQSLSEKLKSLSKKDRETISQFIGELSSKENMMRILGEFERINALKDDTNAFIEETKDFVDDDSKLDAFNQAKEKYENVLTTKIELETKINNLEQIAVSSANCSVENFKKFLADKQLSTIHAEEIFNLLLNKQGLGINKDDFKMRKCHPKRDALIKKGLIPTAITSAAIGGVVAAIATSGLIAGSTIANVLPVMSSKALTIGATATLGAGIGLISTPIVFFAKNKLTKLHYKTWYKSAKRNLRDFETGTSIENLHITKLMNKIEKTKHSILNLNNGNWFTRKLKFVPKHILNAVNRNRIHHLEAYTEDLFRIYNNRNVQNQDLNSIIDLIKSVDDFVNKDVFESKLNAMLTCKENGKHTHQSTIENIDIYANLKMATSALASQNNTSSIKPLKKNLDHKKAVANDILNNGFGLVELLGVELNNNKFEKESETDENENILVNENIVVSEEEFVLDHEEENINETENVVVEEIIVENNTSVEEQVSVEKQNISSKSMRTQLDEKETTRRIICDRLKNDEQFKEELKNQGFKERTIGTLIEKLTTAIQDGTRTVAKSSSKAGKLYTAAIEKINKEKDILSKSNSIIFEEEFEFGTPAENIVLSENAEHETLEFIFD